MNLQWLEELCALPGVSGREDPVREWLIAHLPEGASYRVDPLGNLLVNPQHGRVMLCAHMDEVGFIITAVEDDGCLRFAHVGGIDSAAYLGKQVRVGPAQHPGVIGLTPVHLVSGEEKRAYPKPEHLVIDIGAATREEALALTQPGDFAVFAPGLMLFGEGSRSVKARAIDDRAGCLLLLELLHANPALCGVFSVREEIGGAASAAAHALQPRYALVLETTTAADLPGIAGAERVCALGGGAVVPFMDSGTVYPHGLYTRAMELAKEHNIPAQTKTLIAGGNDARGIHTAAGGVPTLTISIPCRSLHSPSVVMRLDDAQAVYALAELMWKELCHD